MRRAILVWLVASVGILGGRVARADTPGLELRVIAPPGCPTEAEVIAQVEQLVGAHGRTLTRPLSAELVVRAERERFHLDLSWRTADAQAVRSIEGGSCAEVAQAAAVIVALAADPAEDQPAAAAVPAPNEVTPTPIVAVPAASRAPTAPLEGEHDHRPRAGPSARVRARVAAVVDIGSLPRPAPGALLGGELELMPASLVLDAMTFMPVEHEVPAGAGLFWLSALSLKPCVPLALSRLAFLPCAAAEAHAILSRGRMLAVSDDRWAFYLRFGIAADLVYPLARNVALLAGGGLFWAPSRPEFVIAEGSFVHRPALFAGRIHLGVRLFP